MSSPPIIEIIFPFLIITFFSAIEISIYLLNQYYNYKDQNLPFNRILFALGIFIGFIAFGYVFRIASIIFISYPLFSAFARLLGTLLLLLGVLCFLILISLKSFREIIDLLLIRIVIVLVIYSIISMWLFDPSSIGYLISVMIGLIAGFYAIIFQFKLIKYAGGDVKRRLFLVFIGEMLIGFCLLTGSIYFDFLSTGLSSSYILLIITGAIFVGSIITFFGIYKFPAFLEFNWKKELLGFFAFERENLKLLYKYYFYPELTSDTDIFSREIAGIDQIITHSSQPQEQGFYKIKHENLFIILTSGNKPYSEILYALVIKRDLQSLMYFLKRIITQFENTYKYFLKNLKIAEGKEQALFSPFDDIMQKILLK